MQVVEVLRLLYRTLTYVSIIIRPPACILTNRGLWRVVDVQRLRR